MQVKGSTSTSASTERSPHVPSTTGSREPGVRHVPADFSLRGKAPGYFMAKRIIKLINSVADVVNHDPDVAGRIKVVFSLTSMS